MQLFGNAKDRVRELLSGLERQAAALEGIEVASEEGMRRHSSAYLLDIYYGLTDCVLLTNIGTRMCNRILNACPDVAITIDEQPESFPAAKVVLGQ